ncbi:MAG: triose-phosphate isomerase [Elusimicrobia bacterium]|nr:triose-phosphate isomerase [Elusimicrobiota bacterium]
MRLPLMAGNWKMHKTVAESIAMAKELKDLVAGVVDVELLLCPTFVSLYALSAELKGSNIKTGAQNVFWEEKGAFTGEISSQMVKDAGASYAIIGHSERRQYFGETDETVNKRTIAAFSAQVTPIVCVGETLQEREQDITFKVVETQLRGGMKGLSKEQSETAVIAYEPVWAIGTGKTATPAQAQEVHVFIRKVYAEMYGDAAAQKVRILYGGSVKPDNVAELMACPDIDGGLVGGASLEAASFAKLAKLGK